MFVVYRVASALPAPRWPLGGALLAFVADLGDLFLMDWIGGISDYQRLDKLCDLASLVVFLVVALRWHGQVAAIALVVLLAGKEAQEYLLHVDRFLDGFGAFDAFDGALRTLFGR